MSRTADKLVSPLEPRLLYASVQIDPDFGVNGLLPGENAVDVVIGERKDGSIVYERNYGGGPSILAMKPDGTFTTDYQYGLYNAVSQSFALAKDDGLFVAFNTYENESNPPPQVLHYLANGKLDPKFKATVLPTPPAFKGNTTDYFFQNRIAVDSKNRAYVLTTAGYNKPGTYNFQYLRTYVDRILPTGGLDPSFGDGGRLLLDSRSASENGNVRLYVDSADRMLASFSYESTGTVIQRYTTAGKIDTSFATKGVLSVPDSAGTYNAGIVIDSQSRIMTAVGGGAGNHRVTLRRFTAAGKADSSFSGDGLIDFVDDELGKDIHTILIDPKGKIVGATDGALFRLLADGTPDPVMGGDGVLPVESDYLYYTVAATSGIYANTKLGDEYGYARFADRSAIEYGAASRTIFVTGTAGVADNVQIQAIDSTRIKISVGTESKKLFRADFDHVSIKTFDGDDIVNISTSIRGDVDLSAGRDKFTASDGGFTLNGGAGHDTLITAGGNDVIFPGLGNDSVDAGAGDDYIEDAGGKSTIRGGSGADLIRTGDLNDLIYGNDGNDTIRSAGGDDYIDGGGSRDRIYSSYGNDTLIGSGGNDTLIAGPGADKLYGGTGDDYLVDHRDSLDLTNIDTIDGGLGIDRGYHDDDDVISSIESRLTNLV